MKFRWDYDCLHRRHHCYLGPIHIGWVDGCKRTGWRSFFAHIQYLGHVPTKYRAKKVVEKKFKELVT